MTRSATPTDDDRARTIPEQGGPGRDALSAEGDTGPGRWTLTWLGIAGVVYLASVVDLARSGIEPISVVSGALLTFVMVGAGAIIVLRTDVPLLGWLLVAAGATINSFSAIEFVTVAGSTDAQLVWRSIVGFSPTALLAAIILFPTGRATTRFAQVVLAWAVGSQLVSHGLQLANALGLVGGDWAAYREFGDTAVAVTVFAALAMHVVAYRRRPRTGQLQVKYLILALVFGALSFLVGSGGVLTIYEGTPDSLRVFIDILGPGLIPVAMVLAMTRYRLYEIDRLISRTVGYVLVVTFLGGLGVGALVALTALMPLQDRLATVAATLAVLALFNPVRRRVLAAVDSRFDRTRYVAQQVVDSFGRDIQDVTDIDEIGHRVHTVVSRTVAPTTVAVWQPRGGATS